MIERAKRLAEVLKARGVSYLFIDKFGAILYGYPGTTRDIDLFPQRDRSNCERLAEGLKELGFPLDQNLEVAILKGKDFIQIRGGAFSFGYHFCSGRN
jgi:hypothetical protein